MNCAAAVAGFFSFANSETASTRRLPSLYVLMKKWGSSRSALPGEPDRGCPMSQSDFERQGLRQAHDFRPCIDRIADAARNQAVNCADLLRRLAANNPRRRRSSSSQLCMAAT